MKAKRLIHNYDELCLITDRFEKVKKFFVDMTEEDFDTDYTVFYIVYDQKRYDVDIEMGWDALIYDKYEDDAVCEDRAKTRAWLVSMPLDVKELKCLNRRYYEIYIHNEFNNVRN